MKKLLTIVLAACLLLYPFAAFTSDYGSQTVQTKKVPPVAQTLVREGDFAIKLAAELDIGSPTNEAVAEDLLTRDDITPLNGWISDYPMTPEILGQLQSSLAKAANDGKLPMTAEQATKGLFYLASQMNLPHPAESGTTNQSEQATATGQADQTVINNYYYDQGPPIITYYPPPPDYVYLYDWVPYPVWWFGFWWPGFFICHDFTTVVAVRPFDRDHDGRRDHDGEHWQRGIVSNHVIDPATKRVALVDPVVKNERGGIRPETVIRTENGQRFRYLADLRSENRVPGSTAKETPFGSTTTRSERLNTPEAKKGATSILGRSIERMSINGTHESGANWGSGIGTRTSTEGFRGRENAVVSPRNEGVSSSIGRSQETRNRWSVHQGSVSPSPPTARSYSPPAVRGGGSGAAPSSTFRSFGSGGWQGRGGGGGHVSAGGGCRGRC